MEPRGRNGWTVLVIEDADTCATTLELAFLGIPGLKVVLAATAQEGLRAIASMAGDIGALVTDLNMPRMDGFELIERVRAQVRYARLPIIVVSGDADPRTPDRLARLGVDAFFSKPYSPAEVRRKLEQLLNAKGVQKTA